MSHDDTVCTPLTGLYNEMLAENIREFKSYGTFKDYMSGREFWRLNFEIIDSNIQKFNAAGFTEPPPLRNDPGLLAVDFFDEGKPRVVSPLQKLENGGFDTSYEFRILKRDAEFQSVQISPSTRDVDPDLVDRKISAQSLAEKSPDWPFPDIYQQHNVISLWMHSGKPYFVLNAYGYRANEDESDMVVFQLTPSGHQDICYINVPVVTSGTNRDKHSTDENE